MPTTEMSRRALLKGTGTLIVSFSLWDWDRVFARQQAVPPANSPYGNPDYLDPTSLDSWLAITEDGNVTVFSGKVDLGTGVETALRQICAEELDVPFSRVHMAMGDTTTKTVDQGRTAGSTTVRRAGTQLRQATAAARQELLKLASIRLDAPVERLIVKDGVVSVNGTQAKNVSYGQLVGGRQFNVTIAATGVQAAMNVAPEVRPKHYEDYTIVGQSVPRVDLPPKFTGEFEFTADVRVPGMLHGRVVRPSTYATKPSEVDERSIAHIPGIVKVVVEGSFVGVVAQTEWAAVQAAEALKVTWSAPESKMWANQDEGDVYLQNTALAFKEVTLAETGDVSGMLAKASRTFHATYHSPFILHGMLGTSVAVADVRGDTVTVWSGSQGPFTTRDRVAGMLNLPRRNIDVRFFESAGCFGRLAADDAPYDAVLLSRAVGRPVRVQWSRADEHVWEPKGPQEMCTMAAGIDVGGKIVAWSSVDRTLALTEVQGMPQLAERQIGVAPTFAGNPLGATGGGEIYDFEHKTMRGGSVPWAKAEADPLRTNHIRAPGEYPRVFGSESFIDEIAAGLGVDAVEFRLRYLKEPRLVDVLVAATEKAGWTRRPSPASVTGAKVSGRGVAIGMGRGSYFAAVADVEVDRSKGIVAVKRVTIAHDCGLIINPDGVRMQLDGNAIQGVSRALFEELKFDASGVKSRDWVTYPVIRFKQIPEVQHVLINRPEKEASGAAEPSITVVTPAIGNAIFDAIGARLRRVPFTPARVLSALKDKEREAGTRKA